MAGRGPAPKSANQRVHTQAAARGELTVAAAVGWQHGKLPAAPTGLTTEAKKAWRTWFGAWFAFFWSPDDLPGLRQVIRLYDQVERGEFQRASELRLQMDTYGITPKGQQDRRWQPPAEVKTDANVVGRISRYSHLQPVPETG